jgi:SAM-dependent methyltransferase
MDIPDGLLRCPRTGSGLSIHPEAGLLRSAEGAAYRLADGIARFLEPVGDNDPNRATRTFYDQTGWSKSADGLYEDTARFVDNRAVSYTFNRDGMQRLRKYFRKGGAYLLDAGSGPIPHDELLGYHENFDRRICIDLSLMALAEAQRKIRERGVYLQGDLTRLPLMTGSVDAAMCYHVIYQLPPELQALAFREIWRVLKPGGLAIIVYWWPGSKLAWRARRLARYLLRPGAARRGPGRAADTPASEAPAPDHHPQTRDWFESQNWPFRYDFDIYRIVDNVFLREAIPDNWTGAVFLKALSALQTLAPAYCGRHGELPAIIVRKSFSAG